MSDAPTISESVRYLASSERGRKVLAWIQSVLEARLLQESLRREVLFQMNDGAVRAAEALMGHVSLSSGNPVAAFESIRRALQKHQPQSAEASS